MIEDRFNIAVTYEAIRKSYHANKYALSAENSKDNKVDDSNRVNSMPNNESKKSSVPTSEFRAILKKKSTNKKDFDTSYEDMSTEEINYLFSSSEDS